MFRLVPLLLVLVTACGGSVPTVAVAPTVAPQPTPACPDRAAEFIRLSQDLREQWDDALTLADSTPRGSLPPQIADLQRIRRETEDLEVPDCAAEAKEHLVGAMDAGIDGFIAFLGQEDQSIIDANFRTVGTELAAYQNELDSMAGLTAPAPVVSSPRSTSTPAPPKIATCKDEAELYELRLSGPLSRWDVKLQQVLNGLPDSLSSGISELGQIQRDITAVEAPLCLGDVPDGLSGYMQDTVSALIGGSEGVPEDAVRSQVDEASAKRDAFQSGLDAVP